MSVLERVTFKGLAQRVVQKSKGSVEVDRSGRRFNYRGWFVKQLQDLCNVTALHGYSQIVRSGYSALERTVWSCAVVASTLCAITLLMISWSWNVETPTVTVIAQPTMAVCPRSWVLIYLFPLFFILHL